MQSATYRPTSDRPRDRVIARRWCAAWILTTTSTRSRSRRPTSTRKRWKRTGGSRRKPTRSCIAAPTSAIRSSRLADRGAARTARDRSELRYIQRKPTIRQGASKRRAGRRRAMEYTTGIILLAVFLVVVVLIVRGQSPVIMLLLLAIAWALIAGIGVQDVQAKVLQDGGVKYASAVIVIVFGAWFAQVLIQTGIAESVIRSAAELAGDRPFITAIVINLVTALLFMGMYGVGAAIAIGVVARA